MKNELISRAAAIGAIGDAIRREPSWNHTGLRIAKARIQDLPSAEPQPSELARDIATIIENEMDMRVILQNADAEPCDFCIYNEDCEEMRIYCPARGRKE